MDEQELIQAIIEAGFGIDDDSDSDALTTGEIVELSSLTVRKVRQLIKPLMKSGHVEVVYVMRPTLRTPLTGRLSRVPGYKLTDKGKEELGSIIKA